MRKRWFIAFLKQAFVHQYLCFFKVITETFEKHFFEAAEQN